MTSDMTPEKDSGRNEQALDFGTRCIFSVPMEHHQSSAHEHAPRPCASHESFTTQGYSSILSIDRSKRLSLDRLAALAVSTNMFAVAVYTQTPVDYHLCQDMTDAPYNILAAKNPSPVAMSTTNIVTGNGADNSQIATNYMQNSLDTLNHCTIGDNSYTMNSWVQQDIHLDPYHTLAAVSTAPFTTPIKVAEVDSNTLGLGNLTTATYGSTGSVKN